MIARYIANPAVATQTSRAYKRRVVIKPTSMFLAASNSGPVTLSGTTTTKTM